MSIIKFSQKSVLDLQLEKLTPPRKKNWNFGKNSGKRGYVKEFSSNFIEYIFPYILRNMRELSVPYEQINLLDIGCGWAPMAIPFVIYEGAKGNNRENQIGYLGIDIREDAIRWLTKTYANYPYVKFHWHQAKSEADYIGAQENQSKTNATSDGAETGFKVNIDFKHNVQWSSSVFTHLTPQACLQALKFIRNSSVHRSVQINTWLIIDDESRYALAAEIADRKLPFDCGEYLTYAEQNPLVCTAYKIEVIEKMYADSGLEIVRIDKGSWRGPANSNGANHYQDIVISRPSAKLD